MANQKGVFWQNVRVGDIRISRSGKTLIIFLNGGSYTVLCREMDALLSGSVRQIPIKARYDVHAKK